MSIERGEILFYQTKDGDFGFDVHPKDKTVWVTQDQMQELFDRDQS